jgi:mono/diheme cytochrome c family protein
MSDLSLGRKQRVRKLACVSIAGVSIAMLEMAAISVSAATLPPSGPALYREYCSQCHGDDGTGNGAMAKVLTVKPADLTAISKRANGSFPAARIAEIIRYGGDVAGHGPHAMPVWGKVFSEAGGGGKGGGAYSREAVIELKNYLESIQQK